MKLSLSDRILIRLDSFGMSTAVGIASALDEQPSPVIYALATMLESGLVDKTQMRGEWAITAAGVAKARFGVDGGLGTDSTRRPDPWGDQYEGRDLALARMDAIWSVGKTPADAIAAFCLARTGKPVEEIGDLIVGSDKRFAWGFSFVCDGTSFKAAGINVPGGVVMTWWK